MSELANWKCHKIVKAGKIVAFGNSLVAFGDIQKITVEDANGEPCKIDVPKSIFARGEANVGDYIVIYDDDYKSWSPRNVFEDGYTRI